MIMKHIEVKATKRVEIGKKATKAIRKEDSIPAVIYGASETLHITTQQSEVRGLIYTPEVLFADIIIDGKKHISLVKEVQYHPVTDKILHIDFYEVTPEKEIKVAIPLKFEGSSVGVKIGGKLKQNLKKITVKAKMDDIPENFVVDVTDLNIAQSIRVRDLQSDTLQFVDAPITIIVTVVSTRGTGNAETTEATA